jgi:uncharacterized protein (TIGR00299 family) protein
MFEKQEQGICFKKGNPMKILYFDCFGGISGDMAVGALIDAGACFTNLHEQLQLLGLEGYTLQAHRDKSYGFQGTRFQVQLKEKHQPPRTWQDIARIIEASALSSQIKQTALSIFQKLARAEGKVHGVALEQVHFHEVGAIDSIIDIVGTVVALQELGIEKVYCSPLPAGCGYVRSRHGTLPIPAPATAELLKGLPLRPLDVEGELVTPTGAAIAVALACQFGSLPAMTISQIGYGLGNNDYGIPNFLRVFIGEGGGQQYKKESTPEKLRQEISVLQTSIDDMNPEILAFTAEKILNSGALDVSITPVIMKKGRPGSLLTVLCLPETQTELIRIIFQETTTLGVRVHREERYLLPRQEICVQTDYGSVRVKIANAAGGGQISPEYEDCRKLAREKNIPLKSVYQSVVEAAEKFLNKQ